MCGALRNTAGGAEDLELPIDQLARLAIRPRAVLIVENLETGLALPDIEGAVAVMKLGAAVKLIDQVKWIGEAHCVYWGDLDTFGFEILSRARSVVPSLRSVLMDAATLLEHKSLCVTEPTQVAVERLPLLTSEEREVFDGLRSDRWGTRLRLEQERIPWDQAMRAVRAAIGHCARTTR